MSEQIDVVRKSTVFAIPEESHTELVRLRNHLRLMAQLTKAGGSASDPDLRPDAMAWCFSRMAKEVEEIIDATWFSTELVNTHGGGTKDRYRVHGESEE